MRVQKGDQSATCMRLRRERGQNHTPITEPCPGNCWLNCRTVPDTRSQVEMNCPPTHSTDPPGCDAGRQNHTRVSLTCSSFIYLVKISSSSSSGFYFICTLTEPGLILIRNVPSQTVLEGYMCWNHILLLLPDMVYVLFPHESHVHFISLKYFMHGLIDMSRESRG